MSNFIFSEKNSECHAGGTGKVACEIGSETQMVFLV